MSDRKLHGVIAAIATPISEDGSPDIARATKLADEIAQKRPFDTSVQFVSVPLVKAQIELNHGNGAKAVDLLKSASSYDRQNAEMLALSGQAFLANHQQKDAEKEFERAVEIRPDFRDELIGQHS